MTDMILTESRVELTAVPAQPAPDTAAVLDPAELLKVLVLAAIFKEALPSLMENQRKRLGRAIGKLCKFLLRKAAESGLDNKAHNYFAEDFTVRYSVGEAGLKILSILDRRSDGHDPESDPFPRKRLQRVHPLDIMVTAVHLTIASLGNDLGTLLLARGSTTRLRDRFTWTRRPAGFYARHLNAFWGVPISDDRIDRPDIAFIIDGNARCVLADALSLDTDYNANDMKVTDMTIRTFDQTRTVLAGPVTGLSQSVPSVSQPRHAVDPTIVRRGARTDGGHDVLARLVVLLIARRHSRDWNEARVKAGTDIATYLLEFLRSALVAVDGYLRGLFYRLLLTGPHFARAAIVA